MIGRNTGWMEPQDGDGEREEPLTDAELLARIEYLKTAKHLGSWGARQLSICEAAATSRKLKYNR